MDANQVHPETSFVIRLWLERRPTADAPCWRFQVRHVQSGEQAHCLTLADVVAFIARQSGVPGPRWAPWAGYEREEVGP